MTDLTEQQPESHDGVNYIDSLFHYSKLVYQDVGIHSYSLGEFLFKSQFLAMRFSITFIDRFMVVYLDDIMVYNRTRRRKCYTLEGDILTYSGAISSSWNWKSAHLPSEEILFVGALYWLAADDIRMAIENVRAIAEWLTK